MNWQDILAIIVPLGAFSGWIYSRIDKRFCEIKTEMKEIRSELSNEMKEMRSEVTNEFKLVRNDLSNLNTKIAVIESKISDISTNVTHLMWHHQTLPQKEVKEE